MYLVELHTPDPLPGDYAGHPVEHPSPDVAVVDVDANFPLNAIDLALRWATHHGATVTAVTLRGATLASLRRTQRPQLATVSGDGWREVFYATRQLGENRDEQLELWRRIDQAAADGRLTLGRHPDHAMRVVRIEAVRQIAAEEPRPDDPGDLIHVAEAVTQFGASAIDIAIETGRLAIESRNEEDGVWWFRRGDLARLSGGHAQ